MLTQPSRKRFLKMTAVGVVLLVAAAVFAAEQSGILFPNWAKPVKGTYASPESTVGKQSTAERPWSQTTYQSSIEGKPLSAKPITVVGEIIDLSCYLQVGKHGDKHRDCGQKCARAGEPIGLLTEKGDVYMLMAEEHDPRRDGMTNFREKAIDAMAYVVTVNGTLSDVNGQKAIYVQGFVKK
jgi:hypothetical protein